jgi:hypothetical protein
MIFPNSFIPQSWHIGECCNHGGTFFIRLTSKSQSWELLKRLLVTNEHQRQSPVMQGLASPLRPIVLSVALYSWLQLVGTENTTRDDCQKDPFSSLVRPWRISRAEITWWISSCIMVANTRVSISVLLLQSPTHWTLYGRPMVAVALDCPSTCKVKRKQLDEPIPSLIYFLKGRKSHAVPHQWRSGKDF